VREGVVVNRDHRGRLEQIDHAGGIRRVERQPPARAIRAHRAHMRHQQIGAPDARPDQRQHVEPDCVPFPVDGVALRPGAILDEITVDQAHIRVHGLVRGVAGGQRHDP
jgi:hypothetical protein